LGRQRKTLDSKEKILLETEFSDDGVYKITPGCELSDTGWLLRSSLFARLRLRQFDQLINQTIHPYDATFSKA
jgi:hypothetical protein